MKPSSVQEAIAEILATFPGAELQAWAALPEDDALLRAHFELGMWIRNNWVHGDGSPLIAQIKEAAWIVHDDDVSSLLVRAVWRVLNGAPCPTLEEMVGQARRWV